jgi:rare lipoprotein A
MVNGMPFFADMSSMRFFFLSMMCFFLLFPIFSQENDAAFRQEGIASWYGIEFAGRPTASGEIFNPDDMTAAHPKLPFGTFLKVTNTHNGKQVIVRVNDRGPFAAARIIDLSERAAEHLDMIITGTAPVIVEAVNLLSENERLQTANNPNLPTTLTQAPPDQSLKPVITGIYSVPGTEGPNNSDNLISSQSLQTQIIDQPPVVNPIPEMFKSGTYYRIQVGAYKNAKYAVDAFTVLKDAGLTPAYERYNDLYRVVLANIQSDNVQSVIDTLEKVGFAEILIKEER